MSRADQVSAEFFEAFKAKLEARRQSSLACEARSDWSWFVKMALSDASTADAGSQSREEKAIEMKTVQAASRAAEVQAV